MKELFSSLNTSELLSQLMSWLVWTISVIILRREHMKNLFQKTGCEKLVSKTVRKLLSQNVLASATADELVTVITDLGNIVTDAKRVLACKQTTWMEVTRNG